MWRKLLFFGLMYFVQGSALAYIVNFQKPFLAGKGVSKEAIGLFTSLLLVPFIAKVFLGYVSDRWPLGRMGARKPYMLIGLSLFTICYASLAGIDPGDRFALFAAVTWLASLGLAWFDACADGWAVDVAKENEQSGLQAAMIGGKSLGLVLLSAGFGHMVLRYGFTSVFITLSALSASVCVLIWFTDFKTTANSAVAHSWRDVLKGSFLFFAAFGVVYSIASFGTDGLLTLHLTEVYNANSLQVGMFGMARGLGALAGAVAYALMRPHVTLSRVQYAALVLLGLGCLVPLASLPSLVAAALWGLCWGFQETAYVTLAMRFAKGKWAATIFAVAMIFSNIGTSIGEALAAPLVPQLGYEGVFTVFAVVAWMSLLLAVKIFASQRQYVN